MAGRAGGNLEDLNELESQMKKTRTSLDELTKAFQGTLSKTEWDGKTRKDFEEAWGEMQKAVKALQDACDDGAAAIKKARDYLANF